LTVSLGKRFDAQLAEIKGIFDHIQNLIESYQREVEATNSPSYQRIKRQIQEKSEENPFVAAERQLDSILRSIGEQLQAEEEIHGEL
jgi:tetrahydromethanopterin S-methyltransferase subunit F